MVISGTNKSHRPKQRPFVGECMTEEFDDQYAEKNSIVKELFVATADDNYIVARWCFHQNLNVDFFWQAVHCVEKYLKASLLLNGENAKKHGHDITRIFPYVRALAPELLPTTLSKPDKNMPDQHWRIETIDSFIERLYRDGQAHNRYQLYGYVRHAEDLFKLDQLVFYVRRLCQPLEVHFLGKKRDGVTNQSKRQRILQDESSWKLNCKLEDTMEGRVCHNVIG
jgi:HEPN domain-containing protein